MFSQQIITVYSRIGQDKAGKPALLGETSIPSRLVKCFEFHRSLKLLPGIQTSCFLTRSPLEKYYLHFPAGIFDFPCKNLTQKVKVSHVQGRFMK